MEQRNELGASAEDSGHAFRYNLVAEPTRISASIVGASDGIYYDFNGERHWISPQEVEAVGMSGRSNHDEYQHQEEDPQDFATVSELLRSAKGRPSPSLPGVMPISYSDRYSVAKSKYLHWFGYRCGGRRATDRVAELTDYQFENRVLMGDPKVCKKCKVRWRATNNPEPMAA